MGIAGILLTGGGSTRMGSDKATLRLRGSVETLARRTARLLAGLAEPCVEVGPGHSGLASVREVPPGGGPLAALAQGWTALQACDAGGPVLVVATDLPALDIETLRWLAARPEAGSVVPVVDGRPQPLCARWSASDLGAAQALVAEGQRSMRALVERCAPALVEAEGNGPFADADTPGAARQLGLVLPSGEQTEAGR
jgi:molybdopterin-guanine dinucleotide biosynthesis protein A